MKNSFEWYENNGGVITLFVLDEDGNPVFASGNWEYEDGSIRLAISELEKDPDSWKLWGGDFGGDIEMPWRWTVDEDDHDVREELTLQEMYESERVFSDLIVWSTSDGGWDFDRKAMGAAGYSAFGLEDAWPN